jgi:hypothetical protein
MKKILITLFLVFLVVCISTAQDKVPQYNTSFIYTGFSTINDLPSHGTPQNIYQDPNNPDRIHIVGMHLAPGGVTGDRRIKYYYSSNRGQTWAFIANVPDAYAGFPVVTIMSNGNPLISVNTSIGAPNGYRAQWFYGDGPGLGTFTNLDHPQSIGDYNWPRTVATNSITLPNKFVSMVSTDARDSAFWTTGTSLGPYPGTFSPWHFFPSDVAETFSIARGADGRIGIVYIANPIFLSGDYGSVFFMESTNNGTSFSTPTKIYNANISPAGDSLGAFQGIQLIYQENIPKVVFDVCKQGLYSYFPNDKKNHIRFWSTSLPGSDPNRSIKIVDTSHVGYHPYIYKSTSHEWFLNICRPTIGVSIDGTGLFAAFMVPSIYTGGAVDTTSFMDTWFMYSTNSGSNWVAPVKINPVTPIREWKNPCLSIYNDNTINYYYANLLLLSDSIPGCYPYNPGNGQSNAKFMFVRIEIPRTTGINNISSNTPGEYKLYQNYPNPFNPSANIRYQITNNIFVNLKVYDILGKEVATLVNEKQSPGTYEVTFDARLHGQGSSLSSGIYFYKLEAGNFSDIKRMVLIK